MEVLDAKEMRLADNHAIETLAIPGLVLMENAGLRAAEIMQDEIEGLDVRPVTILCGGGNNGGDGFVIARHLDRVGAAVRVLIVGRGIDELEGDAATMAGAWVGLDGALAELRDEEDLVALETLGPADVVVDALFGTGLSRPIRGLARKVVGIVNASGAEVVAVDIPSGLHASKPSLPGPVLSADLTVTFGRPKPALLLPPAEDHAGDVVVVDIGIPDASIQHAKPSLHWVLPEEAALLVPERDAEDHKGRAGHVLVAAGSPGRAGAAALTGWAALVSGAGLVTVAAKGGARQEVASFAPELMTESLPATKSGALGEAASKTILGLAEERDVLAIGPGLGVEAGSAAQVRRAVKSVEIPVVLDADGLGAFSGRHFASLAKRKAPLVLTPHPGEAARLAGVTVEEIQADRVGWARKIASASGGVCILKGYRTICADPEGHAFINPTGNPGMASGGMGDVLTGLVAGFIGQGLDTLEAAILAVFLHGLAGDAALSGPETEHTLTAGSLLQQLPDAFRILVEARDEESDEE